MWTTGTLTVKNNVEGERHFEYQVKHFENGSEFGINEGRISKLWVRDTDTRKVVINYDRGWDVEPQTACEKEAYDLLMERYN